MSPESKPCAGSSRREIAEMRRFRGLPFEEIAEWSMHHDPETSAFRI